MVAQLVSASQNAPSFFPVVTPSDFVEVEYKPGLLLPTDLDPRIMQAEDYQHACKYGFQSYFDDMYQSGETLDVDVFVEHIYTRQEVFKSIVDDLFQDDTFARFFREPISLEWRAGFNVGWLSALALTDRPLAMLGVHFLGEMIRFAQSKLK